ncbi:MAG: enoyl-CoA hydratase/isomerase family protein [Acidobacteria bacterium]|nr:enoyl-CoA hydratase/isomerase family protein [Acidobacteriota bacterium]
MAHQFIQTRREGPIEYLTLNRPEVRNAFNEDMIQELTAWAAAVEADKEVRVVVLAGAGSAFCAGADLTWMARMASHTPAENVRDATTMARMYSTIDRLPIPLIGRVHGAALGGGAGLAAVCDIVVADEHASFGFTEVKFGILPAIVSPYVLAKIGASAARELFLTGMRFGAERAREIGLVHAVVAADQMDRRVAGYVREILSAAPEAVAAAKALLKQVARRPAQDTIGLTADAIAARRSSAEGQEGMRAFLEKRKARWNVSPDPDRQPR